ncbi:hypothetical protein [Cryobacterium zhongshanensis]|uniref:Uncharacterized protein n=1 Tax=Cryobacterium zhongshanensis TaxID=2928153 RepID=A0AA41QU21_9MICO|nr:hypothetical protein [Cryobacterium zhongshanensis]MCI4656266.1 hypothetical protein [Cryobacterium zhongshanensis]
MNLLDHARIIRATLSYDAWLDFAGVPGRRRRDLRRELRANLSDAAALVGSREAVRGLGSTRAMAAAASAPDPTRPHWTVAFTIGMSLFGLSVLAETLAALSWLDGARAATPESPVAGSLTFFPGSSLAYSPSADGFSLSINFGWVCLAVGLVSFIVAAQPWRLLIRSTASLSQ